LKAQYKEGGLGFASQKTNADHFAALHQSSELLLSAEEGNIYCSTL
jgi:hypothetical protein